MNTRRFFFSSIRATLASVFFNPYAALRRAQSDALFYRSLWVDASARHRETHDDLRNATAALNVCDQNVDAFMAEREDLKDIIGTQVELGLQFLMAGASMEDELTRVAAEADKQAQETLEAVAYVKAVETVLSAAGIHVEDGENGPIVVVDTEAVIAGLKAGTTLTPAAFQVAAE